MTPNSLRSQLAEAAFLSHLDIGQTGLDSVTPNGTAIASLICSSSAYQVTCDVTMCGKVVSCGLWCNVGNSLPTP